MAIDLDALEKLARSASAGQWEMIDSSGNANRFGLRVSSGYQCFFDASRPNQECSDEVRANVSFIGAANPVVMLELIHRLREAEKDAVPAGWKLAPIKPDAYMMAIGASIHTGNVAVRVWNAMLAAAPASHVEGEK